MSPPERRIAPASDSISVRKDNSRLHWMPLRLRNLHLPPDPRHMHRSLIEVTVEERMFVQSQVDSVVRNPALILCLNSL